MKWYHWALLPLIVLAALLGWIFGRNRTDIASTISLEFDAIEAKAEAKKLKAQHGAEKASELVEQEYAANLKRLNDEELQLAKSLRGNPGELAAFLVRAGSVRM